MPASDIPTELKARSLHVVPRGEVGAVLCSGDGICSQYDNPSLAIGAVAIVLVLGLVNMMRGGSPYTSQKLMRLRVVLQFVALVIIMAALWMMGRWDTMVVLNKIYTRTGDDGTTSLGSGERRKKYDLRVAAYGTLDEANAAIGIVRLHTVDDPVLDRDAVAHPERHLRRRSRPLHS